MTLSRVERCPALSFSLSFFHSTIFRRNLLRQRVDYQGADQNLRT